MSKNKLGAFPTIEELKLDSNAASPAVGTGQRKSDLLPHAARRAIRKSVVDESFPLQSAPKTPEKGKERKHFSTTFSSHRSSVDRKPSGKQPTDLNRILRAGSASSSSETTEAELTLKFEYVERGNFPMLGRHLDSILEANEKDIFVIFRPISDGLKKFQKMFGEDNICGKFFPVKAKSADDNPTGIPGILPLALATSKKAVEISEHIKEKNLSQKEDSTPSEHFLKKNDDYTRYQHSVDALLMVDELKAEFDKKHSLVARFATPSAYHKRFYEFLEKKSEEKGYECLKELIHYSYPIDLITGYKAKTFQIGTDDNKKDVFFLAKKGESFNGQPVPLLDDKGKMTFVTQGKGGKLYKVENNKHLRENGQRVEVPLPEGAEITEYKILHRTIEGIDKVILPDYDMMTMAEINPYEDSMVPVFDHRYGFIHTSTKQWIRSKAMTVLYKLGFLTHGMEVFNPYPEDITHETLWGITPDKKLVKINGIEGLLQVLNIYKALCKDAGQEKNLRLYAHYAYGIMVQEDGVLVINQELAKLSSEILAWINDFGRKHPKEAKALSDKMIENNIKFIRSYNKGAIEEYIKEMYLLLTKAEQANGRLSIKSSKSFANRDESIKGIRKGVKSFFRRENGNDDDGLSVVSSRRNLSGIFKNMSPFKKKPVEEVLPAPKTYNTPTNLSNESHTVNIHRINAEGKITSTEQVPSYILMGGSAKEKKPNTRVSFKEEETIDVPAPPPLTKPSTGEESDKPKLTSRRVTFAPETTIETPKIIEKEEHPLVKQFTRIKESNNPIWIKKPEIVERNKDGVMQRTVILVHPNHPDDESYNITLTKIKGERTKITCGENAVAVAMRKDKDGKPTLIVGSYEHGTYHIQSPEDFKNLPAPLLSRVNVTAALAQKPKAGLGLSS